MTATATQDAPMAAPASGKVTYAWLRWAGGEHRFRLRLEEPLSFLAIPDPYARLQRLLNGHWSTDDIFETIERGLIYGHFGISKMGEAARLVDKHCRQAPLAESLPLAQTIMAVSIFGVAKDAADTVSAPEALTPEQSNGE